MDEDIQDEYARLLETNTIVAAIGTMVDLGIDEVEAMKAGIVGLAKGNAELTDHVLKLSAIAPVRFQMPDGKLLRWDAPDEFVPAILADLAQTGIIEPPPDETDSQPSTLNPQPDPTDGQEKTNPQANAERAPHSQPHSTDQRHP